MKRSATLGGVCALAASLITAQGQTGAQAEKLLESARHKEVVEGNLKGAIEQYRKVAIQFKNQPEVAARAPSASNALAELGLRSHTVNV